MPNESTASLLKQQVKSWLHQEGMAVKDNNAYLSFQVGLTPVAVFLYRIQLPSRAVHCATVQAYILGRFASALLDDSDLASINRSISAGQLVRAGDDHLLLNTNFIAEGMVRADFLESLERFKRDMETADREIAAILT